MSTNPYAIEVEDLAVTVDAQQYIDEYRDAAKFEACCKQCPNYGSLWCCPPFDFDWLGILGQYSQATIYATKIKPLEPGLPISAAELLTRPERLRMESFLLRQEMETGGRAFAYAGRCLHCPEGECARTLGLPCRHPELVRPSLEAAGFDISKTLSQYFGMQLQWGADGKLPAYLTLVTAIFHTKK